MKKLFVVLMLFMSISAYAQSIDTIDGNFWVSCNETQKASIIFGYFLSMGSTQAMIGTFNEKMESGEYTYDENMYAYNQAIIDWTIYPVKVSEVVIALDYYYAKVSARVDPIIYVIPYLYDKEWW